MATCNYEGCRKKRVKGGHYCREHESLDSMLSESELSQYRILEAEIRADTLAQTVIDYEIKAIQSEMRAMILNKRQMAKSLKERVSKNREEYATLLAGIKDSRGIKNLAIDPDTGEVADIEES